MEIALSLNGNVELIIAFLKIDYEFLWLYPWFLIYLLHLQPVELVCNLFTQQTKTYL